MSVFFVALTVPTAILIYQAFSQMKWETFRQYQIQAEELASRIDNQFESLIQKEEARPFVEYSFLNVAGNAGASFLQRSPLSAFPVDTEIPGLIGYFQVGNQGEFSTPLLPPTTATSSYGIGEEERSQRFNQQKKIQQILSRNQLVTERTRLLESRLSEQALPAMAPADSAIASDMYALETAQPGSEIIAEQEAPQAAFDRLNKREVVAKTKPDMARKLTGSLGWVEELQLNTQAGISAKQTESKTGAFKARESSIRKEQAFLPEPLTLDKNDAQPGAVNAQRSIHISTFESEIDPFSFSLLDSGHFVLFRKVWRSGQRYTQGILFDQQAFLQGMIEAAFKETSLYIMSNLVVAYQGEVFSVFSGMASRPRYASATELRGELLYQTRLSSPLADMQLIFSITQLPLGAGANVIIWTTFIITLVLLSGFFFLYRLGIKQIALAQQQQDFVSAVSHELKTPLTSIRMYGEMLREGWADEEKKNTYYDYIYDESERLSRLINNVLQLARMTRNDLQLNLKPITVSELLDTIQSKISSQLERSGFQLTLDSKRANGETVLHVDPDAFIQVIINLVDNAVKFSSKAKTKRIDIRCKPLSGHSAEFSVRDYGPGIARNQLKKIFKLFYRSENELTRETVGTGIGLALVNQLVTSMNGKVDVLNREPGAEFRITLPIN